MEKSKIELLDAYIRVVDRIIDNWDDVEEEEYAIVNGLYDFLNTEYIDEAKRLDHLKTN